jgi:hypothetical protein
LELGIRDRAALAIQRSKLRRLELAESVERHNPGKRIDAEKLRFPDAPVKQARKNVGEH